MPRSLPAILRRAKKTVAEPAGHPPSLRTALVVFIAVLILFGWLHLILALQITATGIQIQVATNQLRKQERDTTALQRAIAEEESPTTLAIEALQLGYKPREPVYLPLKQPLVVPGSQDQEQGGEEVGWQPTEGGAGQ